MKATKETIRSTYSIKIAKTLTTIYGTGEAYLTEFKSVLSKINTITKSTKKKDLEFELQEVLLNYTR